MWTDLKVSWCFEFKRIVKKSPSLGIESTLKAPCASLNKTVHLGTLPSNSKFNETISFEVTCTPLHNINGSNPPTSFDCLSTFSPDSSASASILISVGSIAGSTTAKM